MSRQPYALFYNLYTYDEKMGKFKHGCYETLEKAQRSAKILAHSDHDYEMVWVQRGEYLAEEYQYTEVFKENGAITSRIIIPKK